MSGNEEKVITKVLPDCGYCGQSNWFKGEQVTHYYDLSEADGKVYISADGDYDYRGEFTDWHCVKCGRKATVEQHAILEDLFIGGTWT